MARRWHILILVCFCSLIMFSRARAGSTSARFVTPVSQHIRSSRSVPSHVQSSQGMVHLLPTTAVKPQSRRVPGPYPFVAVTSNNGLVTLHFYDRPSHYATLFFQRVQRGLAIIQDHLGLGLIQPVSIYIYGSRSDFLYGAQPRNPAETGAYAVFTPPTIYLQDSPDQVGVIDDVIAHELTHIVLNEHGAIGGLSEHYYLYPRWYDEGLAAFSESDTGADGNAYAIALLNAQQSGQLIDPFTLFVWTYPSDPHVDFLAYSESRDFLRWMYQSYGQVAFQHFIALAVNGNLPHAAATSYGVTLRDIQNRWRAQVGLPPASQSFTAVPTLAPVLTVQTGVLGGLATLTTPVALTAQDPYFNQLLESFPLALLILVLCVGIAAVSGALRTGQGWWRVPHNFIDIPPAETSTDSDNAKPIIDAIYMGVPSPSAATQLNTSPVLSHHLSQHGTLLTAWRNSPTFLRIQQLLWLLGDVRLLALARLLLALCTGVIVKALDPVASWAGVDLLTGLAFAVVGGVEMSQAISAFRLRSNPWYAVTATLVAGVLALGLLSHISNAGEAQGQAYADIGAYHLAISSMDQAFVTPTATHAIHLAWALAADHANDPATAIAQLRAAILVDPSITSANQERASLQQHIVDWTTRLITARQYLQARTIINEQLTSTTCDNTCQAAMHELIGTIQLHVARDQILSKQTAAAFATLHALVTDLPNTAAASQAQLAIAHQDDTMPQLLALGDQGNTVAMDLLLTIPAIAQPGSTSSVLAATALQPVQVTISAYAPSGATSTRAILPVAHVLFMAYTSQSAALTASNMPLVDSSVFAIVATVDRTGKFTVSLPPDYFYAVALEDAPLSSNQFPITISDNILTVLPLNLDMQAFTF